MDFWVILTYILIAAVFGVVVGFFVGKFLYSPIPQIVTSEKTSREVMAGINKQHSNRKIYGEY